MMNKQVVIDDINRAVRIEDYSWAKQVFVDLCADAEIAAHKVGFFGSVTSPGISDIDALAIGSVDQIRRLRELFKEKREQSAVFADLFWHPPVYLLDPVASEASLLHTLDGLTLVQPQGDSICGVREPDYRSLMNVMWFSLLVRVVSGMLRGKTISLRMGLLVHKNLEFSFDYFSLGSSARPRGLPRSADLRERGLSAHNIADVDVLSALRDLFAATCDAFHEFCSSSGVLVDESVERKGLVTDGWRFAIRSGDCLNIRWFGGFSLATVPKVLFGIAHGFLFDQCENKLIKRHRDASKRCTAIYREAGIEYPFVTPFGIRMRSNIIRNYLGRVR